MFTALFAFYLPIDPGISKHAIKTKGKSPVDHMMQDSIVFPYLPKTLAFPNQKCLQLILLI